MLTTFYAALRIGALVTPISTLATPPELAHILATSDVQVLIGARRFLRRDFVEALEVALPELPAAPDRTLWLPSAPHLRSIWLDDAEGVAWARSEEHTSELQSLMRISYAVFCLKKKKQYNKHQQ